ncbi:MAG: sulfatase-like hydrolase/transferase, partial [Gammaproteobacteria bacterium]|nr:sulfatase-like hydrolase/transferase [Gammaproteobacteria bacterium]
MSGNVLLIVIDQWRAEALSCLGHAVAQTPNLDALAADGWLARQHFTVTAPCGPARASLLTGLYAQNHRSIRNGTPLAADIDNIARMARAAGYDPRLFGYTDTSADPRELSPDDPLLRTFEGVLPGFAIGAELNEDNLQGWPESLRRKGYRVPEPESDLYRASDYFADGFTREAALYRAEDSDSAYLVDALIEYIQEQSGQPWFAHLALLRPHPPWIAPEPFNRLIDSEAIPAPVRHASRAAEAAGHPFVKTWLEEQDRTGYCTPDVNVQQISEQQRREIAAVYYGLLAEVDQQIGRLLEFLRASGDDRDTLIIVTADHGEQLGDHWLWNKGGYFDASYHIPLIVRDPRSDAETRGRIEQELFTESVDIVPTILDWLGIPAAPQLSGLSLLPLIHGQRPSAWRRQVVWEFDFRNVQTGFYESRLGLTPD